MTNDFLERPLGHRLKQPAANHEETRQTKEVEDAIIPHQWTVHAEIADMGIDNENHRKSPHCIDVFYSLLRHYKCKGTNKCVKSQRLFGFSPISLYLCNMKERINWIDWAKALAVCCVVFCHLPQSQEWFYYRYLQSVIIVIFFFISGYLKKDRGSCKENWRKYWHGLILPYLLYNAIVYPYWLAKYYLLNGGLPDLSSAMRPIFGVLLFEHENAFCEPLNGPLWYLPAILFMHITIDLCRKTKHQHIIMILLCFLSVILYAANKYYYFAPNLTPMGITKNLPFYYTGYILGQKQLFNIIHPIRDFFSCIGLILLSIALFHWHLTAFWAGQHTLHIVIYYPACFAFLFGVLYGCKFLDTYRMECITNLSIGTLVIIGLHIIPITAVNYVLNNLYNLSSTICYQWYEALIITLTIIMILYPIILYSMKGWPIFIGKS